MFSINVKGKRNPKDIEMVKLQIIFYKTGYPRVSKALYISGLFSEWDQKTQSFKETNPDSKQKNRLLQKERLKYLKIAEKWEYDGKSWIPVELSHYYDKKEEDKSRYISVSQLLDQMHLRISVRQRFKNGVMLNSLTSASKYLYLKRCLEKFTRKKYRREFSKYQFRDINEAFIHDFIQHSKVEGAKAGNAGGVTTKLRRLYATFLYAKHLRIHNVNMEVFYSFRNKLKEEKTVPKAVSKETIQRIEQVDRSQFKKHEKLYLDLFLFSFYAGGMSNIDVCFLEYKSIKDGIISFERIKCDRRVKIVLVDKAKELIEKYKSEAYMNYVFPIFKKRNMTQVQMYGRVKRVSAGVNELLRKICQEQNIEEKITWSTARSSFISLMVDAGYHPLQIAEQVGNSPNTIYKYYYMNTDREKVKLHMNALLKD